MKDITGLTFGSLTAMAPSHAGANYLWYWIYKCKCGNTHTARSNTVAYEAKKGDPEIPSCGCVELIRKTKHGFRKFSTTHPLYKVWNSIKDRCYNTHSPRYQWYGEVGVEMCPEWLNSPEAFINWGIQAGWQKGLHIDKDYLCDLKGIHPHIYSPDTCRFITVKENVGYATNRKNHGSHPNVKISNDGVKDICHKFRNLNFTRRQLSEEYSVSFSTISRILILEGYLSGKERGVDYTAWR